MNAVAPQIASRPLPPQRSVVRGETASDLQRLEAARDTLAKLVLADPAYVPIFQRIEEDIALTEAAGSGDALTRARAIARQIANR